MRDDFKNYIKNYEKSGKGAERKKKRDQTRGTLLAILIFGFILSCLIPLLFVLWLPYLLFCIIYALREWVG